MYIGLYYRQGIKKHSVFDNGIYRCILEAQVHVEIAYNGMRTFPMVSTDVSGDIVQ